jgi:hypothetical protein
MKTTCAHHDLNGVDVIEIAGWDGYCEVMPQPGGEHGVTLIAPQLHECEFWTFQRLAGGVLRCFSDRIGSLSPWAERATLQILLPAGRIGTSTVRVGRDAPDFFGHTGADAPVSP